MKFIVLIGDGMADRPQEALGGRTPLQAAFTPNMDRLAREATQFGLARTLPDGLPTGSDVANLSIMGYDPRRYYTGRAPLEAASMGVSLREGDVAFRCNLITLSFNPQRTKAFLQDHSAGHISSQEARELIEALNAEVATPEVRFYPGVSYRNLMVWHGGSAELECTPPHDILGKDITDYLPAGQGEELLRALMRRSVDVLEHHPVNKARVRAGKRPANSIWLWGQGRRPQLPPFQELYGPTGAVVCAVDLLKGLGLQVGLRAVEVPGATGYLDTNYQGKAEYALRALAEVDLVYLHVEAPDEASHEGSLGSKLKAIEDFDALTVGTLLRGLGEFQRVRVLLMPDHATPLQVRTHTPEPVPFVIYDSARKGQGPEGFSEAISSPRVIEAHTLMGRLIRG
jgi:2,3-bisphosphoglycerate-independent phosphoglycerate mutase